MQFDDFFSEGSYINLPFYNARVSLNISSSRISRQSIKLYNPFSLKAKILKKISFFAILNIPYFRILVSRKYTSGKYTTHIENLLKKRVHSSLYYPTIKDKIVLQLVSMDGKVIGYSKIGLNDSGKIKIKNELQAIKDLVVINNVIDEGYLISEGVFNNFNYLILKELSGTNRLISDLELLNELRKLERKHEFLLINHPRFISLINKTREMKRNDLIEILNKISSSSKELYSLNYEHGDMAPWNVFVDSDNKIRFFDFEYFIKDGIEHLDFINYHYQIAVNLKVLKSPSRIIKYLKSKIQINEFSEIVTLFLIHKIVVNIGDGEKLDKENRLLEFISNSF